MGTTPRLMFLMLSLASFLLGQTRLPLPQVLSQLDEPSSFGPTQAAMGETGHRAASCAPAIHPESIVNLPVQPLTMVLLDLRKFQ
jgi:hypothetical protein